MVGSSISRKAVAAGASLTLALLSGCGSGGSGSSSGPVGQPQPKQPLADQVDMFNKAIAGQSCQEFVPLLYSFTRENPNPGAPPDARECRSARPHLRDLKGVKFNDSAEYGSGGLSQSRPPTTLGVWAVDRDGAFRIESIANAKPQLGTSPAEPGQAKKVISEFIDAVRSKDCKKLEPLLDPEGRLVAGTGGKACKSVFGGAFFAPALKKTPGAAPVILGQTRDFAFAGVATKDAYFTVPLSNSGAGRQDLKVLDVVPSTPVKLPKR